MIAFSLLFLLLSFFYDSIFAIYFYGVMLLLFIPAVQHNSIRHGNADDWICFNIRIAPILNTFFFPEIRKDIFIDIL